MGSVGRVQREHGHVLIGRVSFFSQARGALPLPGRVGSTTTAAHGQHEIAHSRRRRRPHNRSRSHPHRPRDTNRRLLRARHRAQQRSRRGRACPPMQRATNEADGLAEKVQRLSADGTHTRSLWRRWRRLWKLWSGRIVTALSRRHTTKPAQPSQPPSKHSRNAEPLPRDLPRRGVRR
jgi:hypothetical protein